MFEAIYTLARQTPLSLHITAVGDRLRLIVQPHPSKDAQQEVECDGLSEPIALEGAPKELDQDFARLLMNYTAERSSLVEQLAVTTTVLKAAKEKAAGNAAKSLSKSNRNVANKAVASTPQSTSLDDNDASHDGESDDNPMSANNAPESNNQNTNQTDLSLF